MSNEPEIKFAIDCEPCDLCGEPWCDLCGDHYADCKCVGPDEADRNGQGATQ